MSDELAVYGMEMVCIHCGRIIIAPPPSGRPTVNGQPLLTVDDIENAKCICTAQPPCTSVKVTSGAYPWITVAGQPGVSLKALAALTNTGAVRILSNGVKNASIKQSCGGSSGPESASDGGPTTTRPVDKLSFYLEADAAGLPLDRIPAALYAIITVVQEGGAGFQTEIMLPTTPGKRQLVVCDLPAGRPTWGVVSTALLTSQFNEWHRSGTRYFISRPATGPLLYEQEVRKIWLPNFASMLQEMPEPRPNWREFALANRLPADDKRLFPWIVLRTPMPICAGEVISLSPRFPQLCELAGHTEHLTQTVEDWNHFDRSNLEERLLLAWLLEKLKEGDELGRAIDESTSKIPYDVYNLDRGTPVCRRPSWEMLLGEHDVERRLALQDLATRIDPMLDMLGRDPDRFAQVIAECEELSRTTPQHPRWFRVSPAKSTPDNVDPAEYDDVSAGLILDATEAVVQAQTLKARYMRTGRPIPALEDLERDSCWAEQYVEFLTRSPVIGLLKNLEWLTKAVKKSGSHLLKDRFEQHLRLTSRVEQTLLLSLAVSQRHGISVEWIHAVHRDVRRIPLFDRDGSPLRDMLADLPVGNEPLHITAQVKADLNRIRARLQGLAPTFALLVALKLWIARLEQQAPGFPALKDDQARRDWQLTTECLDLISLGAESVGHAGRYALGRMAPAVDGTSLLQLEGRFQVARLGLATSKFLGVAGIIVTVMAGTDDVQRGNGWRASAWFTQGTLALLALVPGVPFWPVFAASLILPALIESFHVSDEERRLRNVLDHTEFGRAYADRLLESLPGNTMTDEWRRRFYRFDSRIPQPSKGLAELRHVMNGLRWKCFTAHIHSWRRRQQQKGIVIQLQHRNEGGPTTTARLVPPEGWSLPALHLATFTRVESQTHWRVSLWISTDSDGKSPPLPVHTTLTQQEPPILLRLNGSGAIEGELPALVLFVDNQQPFTCNLEMVVRPGAIQTIVVAPTALSRREPPYNGPAFTAARSSDYVPEPRLFVSDSEGFLPDEPRHATPHDVADVSFHDWKAVEVYFR